MGIDKFINNLLDITNAIRIESKAVNIQMIFIQYR